MADDSPVDFEKIAKLRDKRGLSQEQCADAMGFKTRQAWNRLENGKQPNVTVMLLARIAAVLGVKAKDLLK